MNRSLPTGAWIAGGLVTAALIIPGVTYAAATMTEIVGTNNKPAKVSKANQLYVAPTDPANASLLADGIAPAVPTGCYDIGPLAPAGSAAVLTGFRGEVSQGQSAKDELELIPGTDCSGPVLADFNGQTGEFSQTISPGIPLPAATDLSVKVTNGSGTFTAKFFTDGYVVPASAIPAGTHARRGALRRVG